MTADPFAALHDQLGVLAAALTARDRHVIPRPGERVTLSGEGIRHETNRSRLRSPGRACPGRVQQCPVIPGFTA
jgi:hypothetical protein